MLQAIDPKHFQELAALDPAEVCKRAVCTWDEANECYNLNIWRENYEISPQRGAIFLAGTKQGPPHEYLGLFMVHYLLSAREIDAAGEWISEKDLPNGPTFFRGPHTIPTHLISTAYGDDTQAFSKRCQEIQGSRLEMGDVAYRFQVAPRIPVAVLFFEGDEDFPPEAKLLYDKTISRHFALDIVYALACAVCSRIAGEW